MKPDVKIRYLPTEDNYHVEYRAGDVAGDRKVPAAFFEDRAQLDEEALKNAITLLYMIMNLPTAFLFGRMKLTPDAQSPKADEEWHLHDVLSALARQNEPSVFHQDQNIELTHALFAFIKEHNLTVRY